MLMVKKTILADHGHRRRKRVFPVLGLQLWAWGAPEEEVQKPEKKSGSVRRRILLWYKLFSLQDCDFCG